MNAKRFLTTWLFALVISLGAWALAQDPPGQQDPPLAPSQGLTMGGGFAGGTFNVFVGGITAYLAQQFPELSVTAAESAGSIQNLQRIIAGEMDMALAFAGDAYLAYHNLELFDTDEHRPNTIRAVGYLYPAVSQIVTLEEMGIRTFEDLAGKRIAAGEPGSGTHMSMERLLRQTGMLDQVTLVFASGTAASDMLKSGRVDAYHVLLGVPNATVTDTSGTHDVHILNTLDVALRSGYFDRYPFYVPAIIPGGIYSGVDEDVETWKDAGIWVVSADLDEELVYQMTQAMFDQAGTEYMRGITPVAGEMGPDHALHGIMFPLHPGAARYWQEAGLEIPTAAQPVGR